MTRKYIFSICLAVFLQTSLFAQISNSYQSMIKVANEKVHPRTSKIAMVNDSVSISYMYGIDTVNVGYHKFFLIKNNSVSIQKAKIRENISVMDIKVLNDTLYFCGAFVLNKNYSEGYVAKADITEFFSIGNYSLTRYPISEEIYKIEPYIDGHGQTYITCLGKNSNILFNINSNYNTYDYAYLPIHGGSNETYSDIIAYKNSIVLLSSFQAISDPSFCGYFLRFFHKTTLAPSFSVNKIQIYGNIRPYFPLLAKSEINNNIYIATAPIIEDDTTTAFLDINKVGVSTSGVTSCYHYQVHLNSMRFNILWGVKSNELRGQDVLFLLTTRADRESRVLYCDFSNAVHPVQIFENIDLDDFYTALEVYNNKYFLCAGGDYNVGYHSFASWDKNSMHIESRCEKLIEENYTENSFDLREFYEPLDIQSDRRYFQSFRAETEKIEYEIKCNTEL